MTGDRDFVVALDVGEADQRRLAQEVTLWLRQTGWAVPDPAVSALPYPAGEPDFFGPRVGGSVENYRGTIACGVTDGLWLAMADMAGPRCRMCGTEVSWESSAAELLSWDEGADEPTFVCVGCGNEALAGDMDTAGSCVVGNPGVILIPHGVGLRHDDLARALADELRREFGGRWAHVHQHD